MKRWWILATTLTLLGCPAPGSIKPSGSGTPSGGAQAGGTAACAPMATSSDTSAAADPGFKPGERIAFVSTADGNPEIYTMDATGGSLKRLTNDPGNDLYPAFSPDRKEIVWCADRGCATYDLYIAWADGSHVRRLTAGNQSATQPVFSPDGTKIAFVLWTGAGTTSIGIMNRDGSDLLRIAPRSGQASGPTWSPDGSTIAYTWTANAEASPSIYTKATTLVGEPVNLTPDRKDDWPMGRLSWSPDGSQMAYAANIGGKGLGLVVMAKNGGNRQELTHGGDLDPVWTPDGQGLVFTTLEGGRGRIARMAADGSGHRILTRGSGDQGHAAL